MWCSKGGLKHFFLTFFYFFSHVLPLLFQVAMATGQVLFQRFYYSKSFVKHNMEVCIFFKLHMQTFETNSEKCYQHFFHYKWYTYWKSHKHNHRAFLSCISDTAPLPNCKHFPPPYLVFPSDTKFTISG